jgi:hypothetical protein
MPRAAYGSGDGPRGEVTIPIPLCAASSQVTAHPGLHHPGRPENGSSVIHRVIHRLWMGLVFIKLARQAAGHGSFHRSA